LSPYNILNNCDGSFALKKYSVDSAIYNFTACTPEAINEAIPPAKPKISTSPQLFSKSIMYYIKKKTQFFKKFKKSKSDYYYILFLYYRKLVKTTITTDKLGWLKTTDDNLRKKAKALLEIYL
jgi:hypothetical protein